MSCLELPAGLRILLLNRNTGRRSSSRWAQGGIAAVTRIEDSAESHADDTLRAGAGLCDGDAVRLLVNDAPYRVEQLQAMGMAFDREGSGLATTLEAAHSHHRVLHVQDQTGKALVEILRSRWNSGPDCCIDAGCASQNSGSNSTAVVVYRCLTVRSCAGSVPERWFWPAAAVAICLQTPRIYLPVVKESPWLGKPVLPLRIRIRSSIQRHCDWRMPPAF